MNFESRSNARDTRSYLTIFVSCGITSGPFPKVAMLFR